MDKIQYVVGTCYIVGSVFLYVGSTMFLNGMFLTVSDSPYFLTYVMEAFKMVYFAFHALPLNSNKYDKNKYPLKSLIGTAVFYSSLLFIATYIFDLGINYTTPSSGLCINTSYTVFTCLFAVWILKEKMDKFKIAACFLATIGIVVICLADKQQTFRMVIGDILCFSSAILYGYNAVKIKQKIPDDDDYPYFMMLGFTGISVTLIFWPGIIILNAIGYELFITPTFKEIILCILISIANSLIPDYFYLKAIILLGPTLCTFIYLLIIPLSMVGDFWYEKVHFNIYFIIGNTAILLSIAILVIGTSKNSHDIAQKQKKSLTTSEQSAS